MPKYQHCCLFFVAFQTIFSSPLVIATSVKPINDWTGFYFGTKAGAIFSGFDTNTSTQNGPMFTEADVKAINDVGTQTINTTGFLSGIEGGYNWQFNQLLMGLEVDIQSLSTNGMEYSNAIPYQNINGQFVITAYAENNWLLTARPRFGWISGHSLFYATSGLSLASIQSNFLFTDSLGAFESQRIWKIKPGFAVGAGIETQLTSHVSLKTEYLFQNFDTTSASLRHPLATPGQPISNWVNLKSNIINLGLNYHINPIQDPLFTAIFDHNQWKTQVGARIFFSSGLTGAPQPLLDASSIGDILASRLTFSGLSATSEEVFARVDHSSGLFTKGYLGAGIVSSGQLNDEDFPAGGNVYSNTLSNASGNLSYATVDLGYTFLKNSSSLIGAFIGYNYFAQNYNIYNCRQLAGSSTCARASELNNFLALSEDDSFNSLRIGVSSEFNLTNQWAFATEAAYLPIVSFNGLDMHNARQLVGPESAHRGDGIMLETILNYQLNDSWHMGLGGRYWTWNMHDGQVIFDFLGENELITEPSRFNAERYGGFLQVGYYPQSSNRIQDDVTYMNWKGLFIGANLGGAWSNSTWSNPFGSTIETTGYVNAAGFGNKIHSSGPIAGIDLHANWQVNHLIYGLGASISGADIRGENTIFSGIGGNNGQEQSNYLGTLVVRIGTPVNRSLFYLNGGAAVLNTQYSINGNTAILNLGTGNNTLSTWGYTGGAGVEYAITSAWSTNVEYDFINIPSHTLSFPSIAFINEQPISVHGNMSVFKLGVNYKLNANPKLKKQTG